MYFCARIAPLCCLTAVGGCAHHARQTPPVPPQYTHGLEPASQPLAADFSSSRVTRLPPPAQPIQQSLPFLAGPLPLVYIATDDGMLELIDTSNNALLARIPIQRRAIVRIDQTGVFLSEKQVAKMTLNPEGNYALRMPAIQGSFQNGLDRPALIQHKPRVVKPPAPTPVPPPDQS